MAKKEMKSKEVKAQAPKDEAKPAEKKEYKSHAELPAFKDESDKSNPGMLMSRLDHSVTISYEGHAMVIPPRGRINIGNTAKLGAIPTGVHLQKK
jgi:hypothetical protein